MIADSLLASGNYLRDVEQIEERPEVAKLIAAASDPSVPIINNGSGNPSESCSATIETFVSIPASEAANLPVKLLSTGGVYIAGRVAVHTLNPSQLRTFFRTFHAQRTVYGTNGARSHSRYRQLGGVGGSGALRPGRFQRSLNISKVRT